MDDNKIWKQIVDFKYNTRDPNILTCPSENRSPFWKGVIWACQAAKMGYMWKIRKGSKVRFWEDTWFGSSSLAIQFWELYVLINEKGLTIDKAWDGENLEFTFRRCVDKRLILLWHDVVSVAQSIVFTEEEHATIWEYHSSGLYNVQSLYTILNFRGVIPVH